MATDVTHNPDRPIRAQGSAGPLVTLRSAVTLFVGERLAGVAAALGLAEELRARREVDFAFGVVPDDVAPFATCSLMVCALL